LFVLFGLVLGLGLRVGDRMQPRTTPRCDRARARKRQRMPKNNAQRTSSSFFLLPVAKWMVGGVGYCGCGALLPAPAAAAASLAMAATGARRGVLLLAKARRAIRPRVICLLLTTTTALLLAVEKSIQPEAEVKTGRSLLSMLNERSINNKYIV
jgi:hypothetical protein